MMVTDLKNVTHFISSEAKHTTAADFYFIRVSQAVLKKTLLGRMISFRCVAKNKSFYFFLNPSIVSVSFSTVEVLFGP